MTVSPPTALTERHARLALAVLASLLAVIAPFYVSSGGWSDTDGGDLLVAVVIAGVLVLLYLRHALAVAAGRRPRGWLVTLALVAVLVYAPLGPWSWAWASEQWFMVASLLLLVPSPWRWPAAALPVLAMMVVAAQDPTLGWVDRVGLTVYWAIGLGVAGLGLWSAVRLVTTVAELRTALAEVEDTAIGWERLRLSRDLHDALGQSLSAVSLKGDLAVALVERDPEAAVGHVRDMAEIARGALHDMQAVTRDGHTPRLREELDNAATLLRASGILTEWSADSGEGLRPDVERLLAWAVREALTNVLRHARARHCTVWLVCRDDEVTLHVENDGARPPSPGGTGVAGLADRARELGGRVRIGYDAGVFRLDVSVPLGAT